MSRTRALGVIGLFMPLGAWLMISGVPVSAQVKQAQNDPMEITTDTPEYCQKLLRRVSELIRMAASPVPQQVVDLTSEGERMCDTGQTRGGIMRVRSALMMMEKTDGPAYR